MEKIIKIDGKDVKLRATAALPRLYRFKFGRDIVKDMHTLYASYAKALKEQGKPESKMTAEEKENLGFSVSDLTIFENMAYIMAKHGDPDNVPNTIDEWMEQFDTFSIYENLGHVIELWGINNAKIATAKKKIGRR